MNYEETLRQLMRIQADVYKCHKKRLADNPNEPYLKLIAQACDCNDCLRAAGDPRGWDDEMRRMDEVEL